MWQGTYLTLITSYFYHQRVWAQMVFSARQHICYSALFANARPSVCLSVCLSVCPAVCHTGGSVKDGYS